MSIYIGKGLPPVPGRIARIIRKWEFVEMHELLLPELLLPELLLPELLASQKVILQLQ